MRSPLVWLDRRREQPIADGADFGATAVAVNGLLSGTRGAIQYSPEKYPKNCPKKCPELCNCSNPYFLNFLAVIFEGFFGTFFGTIFGILFGTVLNCTPEIPDSDMGDLPS